VAVLKIFTHGGLHSIFRVEQQIVTIGRSQENTVQIDHPSVAPVHTTLFKDAKGYFLIDHSTEHGTFVNEARIDKKTLRSGDRIRLGKHAEIIFEIPLKSSDTQALQETIIADDTSRGPISDIHKRITLEEAGFHYERDLSDRFAKAQTQKEHLSAIYQINQAVTETFSSTELAQKVLDLIFRLFPVDRGAVILCDSETQAPHPFSVKVRTEPSESDRISISRTIVGKVITEKSAILAADTYFDERFRNVSSIVQKQIRSVMCVPLHSRGEILGVLYVDSLKAPGVFSEDDLRLLFAVGGALANSIENAWLVEKIKEDERKLTTLERYLPSAVVKHVIGQQESLKLGGQQVSISVLFADIRNFTSLAEQTRPTDLVSLLNEYFSSMADVIFEYGGTLGEYIGDEIMAYFGAPIEYTDHAKRAVAVALRMKDGIRSLREKWKIKGSPIFRIGIGIASGPAVAGNIGSERQMKYTVIGNTVNLASRLCAVAEPGQILISPETCEAVENTSRAVSLGPTVLKGISRPIELYEIISRPTGQR